MRTGSLFHAAIKTAHLEASVNFYTRVLGMTIAQRPDVGFPGAWLQPAPGTAATIHLYSGAAAEEPGGHVLLGAGAIDHLSILCQGYHECRQRLEDTGLPFREHLIPAAGLWQIFVHDPSGVLLELTFEASGEDQDPPRIAAGRAYNPAHRWFDPLAYEQFRSDGPWHRSS
jgi:catechol 2,3-dioxygenase-like lactoylglutathione lyase family enzyme